jgi:hypothetical protein
MVEVRTRWQNLVGHIISAERFLIEGLELAPSYPARLKAALAGDGSGLLLGHRGFPSSPE